MPDYRIIIQLRMGEIKQGIRFSSIQDPEDVRKHFEKKVFEIYPKYLVSEIAIEKIDDESRLKNILE